MGLWERAKRAFINTGRKAGNFVGRAVEKIGSKLNSEPIRRAGFHIQAKAHFGLPVYSHTSSASNAVDVHVELAKVRDSIRPSADKAERWLINFCISQVEAVLKDFLKLIPCAGLSQLEESYQQEIREKLSGQFMKGVNRKLSLDNNECRQVLGIYDDAERKKQAEAYTQQVLESTENLFKKRCIVVTKEYYQKILEIASVELESAQKEFQKQDELLQEMLSNRSEEMIDMERAQTLVTMEKLSVLRAIAFDE